MKTPALLLSFSAIVLQVAGITTQSAVTTYEERSYGEIVDFLLDLETKYPDHAEVFSVQDKYGLPKSKELQCTRNNETVPCEHYVIKITEEATLPDPERPELIFSGAVHGNERVGPQVVVALAELLLSHASRPDGNPWIQHLVKTRTVVIVPTTNAYGYDHNVRRELDVDPNRDFPYNLGENEGCMVTMTARALNELWRDHLFQLGITFHAGTECITYEWGGKNHVKESGESEKSPDDRSQQQLARIMSRFGGKFEESDDYYPDGTMNDVVYAVNGGMEDWGYAASWENEFTTPKPIKQCNPTSFGGYPASKTKYNNATHRAFNVLIETSDNKQPNATSLGDSSTLSDEALSDYLSATDTIGHVPRNVRLSLLYIDLVQPYVLWKTNPHSATVQKSTTFKWEVAGAITVDNTQLKIWTDNESDATLTRAQSGVTRWYHDDLGLNATTNNKGLFSANVDFKKAGTYYVQAVATVDQDWATQGTGDDVPAPKVKPQTHIANARTNDKWLYSNNDRVVQGQTVWSSQAVKIVVA
ncbi:Carboxypeptidase D [Phytophthora citrophthora]|uniref:Carboxypeptidase D n=1 Tax=Phytophthora citrophthora TaxID=4793 RepID=A0AAD9GAT3_9STRA|nr:Carboxypeptidase D [Phytophthora citrophthora]